MNKEEINIGDFVVIKKEKYKVGFYYWKQNFNKSNFSFLYSSDNKDFPKYRFQILEKAENMYKYSTLFKQNLINIFNKNKNTYFYVKCFNFKNEDCFLIINKYYLEKINEKQNN
jgi:hypothetical protein